MPGSPPPRWTDDEFDESLTGAIRVFRTERLEEVVDPYLAAYEVAYQAVSELLELTVDLTVVGSNAVEITTGAEMLRALRYCAAPPISDDDLTVLAEVPTLNPNRLRANPAWAEMLVETVILTIDPTRFPWVREERDATVEERTAAVVATAVMMAQRRLMTDRANESKEKQEQATASALITDAGFAQVDPRTIDTFSDAPNPGQFCRESLFGGRKADLVVRLWDGRCMPIECKVSNSSTNSVKRLNNDAAVKATQWLEKFGSAQTIPAAVLAGVFKRHNLVNAQERGLTIFWAHELDRLIEFVNSTK